MLDATSADPVLDRRQTLYPQVAARAASTAEVVRLAPWFALAGLRPDAVDIARFADGGGGHAPETLALCRDMLSDVGKGAALLYRHCGVQAQPLDPLLPGLLQGLGHDGPVHALRRSKGDASLVPGTAELALVAAMMPTGGSVLLIDDLQERVTVSGAFRPAPVILSLFMTSPARGTPR